MKNGSYSNPWGALKAIVTAAYKSIQLDRMRGIEQKDLTEYHGTVEDEGNGTYSVTGPDAGNRAGYIAPQGSRASGETGYSSEIRIGPNTVGIAYAHPRPADLIHNHRNDMSAAEGAHGGRGVLAITAAPSRGDANGAGRPIFEGYNGSTHQLYGNHYFDQFPDFY